MKKKLNERGILRAISEEGIRQEVYTVIDTNQTMPAEERALWIKVHDALQKLAFYYEGEGQEIWKH